MGDGYGYHTFECGAWSRAVSVLGHDIVPGFPFEVHTAADQYETTGTTIATLIGPMDSIGQGDEVSEAATALRGKVKKISGRLTTVGQRYAGLATALETYAQVLDASKYQAQQALIDATTALTDRDTADGDLAAWVRRYPERHEGEDGEVPVLSYGIDRRPHLKPGGWQRDSTLEEIEGRQSTCDTKIDTARTEISGAWTTFRAAVGQVLVDLSALHDDGLDDGLRDKAARWGHDLHLDDARNWVSDHLDDIATVLGVAALVLCWVPVLGQVLEIAAAVASLAVLARDVTVLCQGGATGKDWLTAGVDLLGVASFGFGRVAGKGLQIADRETSAANRVGESAVARTASGGSKAANEATRTTTLRPSGSHTRELLSSLNPKNVVKDYATEIRTQAKNPSIRNTAKSSNPFTRDYTETQWDSGWRPIGMANGIVGGDVLGYDVAVQTGWAEPDGGES